MNLLPNTTNFNRRAFLSVAAIAPATAATAFVAPVKDPEPADLPDWWTKKTTTNADPHVEWFERWKALTAEYKGIEAQWKAGNMSGGDFEEAADKRLHARWELVKIAANTTATTVAGAAAMAEMFDLEFGLDAFGEGERNFEGQLLSNLVSSLKAMTGQGELV